MANIHAYEGYSYPVHRRAFVNGKYPTAEEYDAEFSETNPQHLASLKGKLYLRNR
jgi:hypothetical protein